MDTPDFTVKKSPVASADTAKNHPELYRRIIDWREKKAEGSRYDPYEILSRKSILALIAELPLSKKDLKKIPGIGKKKMALFGNDILQLIASYCIEYEIALKDEY